jgi:mannose-1-phosphate guanylyltransferase
VVEGGTTLGAGAVVESGATVDASIVGAGAVVETGATVVRCAIGAGARIGPRCRLVDAVIGDGAKIEADNELMHGIRVWPQVTLPAKSVRFSSDA